MGKALAERYAQAGSRVYVTGRRPPPDPATTKHDKGSITTLQSDVSSATAREDLYKYVKKNLPDLNVLINNAGIARPVAIASDGPDTPWTERQTEINTVFCGPVHLSSLLVPLMLANQRPGQVINVTSGVAFFWNPAAPLYAACKAAARSYTTNLRFALRDTPIACIEVIPPMIETCLAGSKGGIPLEDFMEGIWPKLLEGQEEILHGQVDSEVVHEAQAIQAKLFNMITPYVQDVDHYSKRE